MSTKTNKSSKSKKTETTTDEVVDNRTPEQIKKDKEEEEEKAAKKAAEKKLKEQRKLDNEKHYANGLETCVKLEYLSKFRPDGFDSMTFSNQLGGIFQKMVVEKLVSLREDIQTAGANDPFPNGISLPGKNSSKQHKTENKRKVHDSSSRRYIGIVDEADTQDEEEYDQEEAEEEVEDAEPVENDEQDDNKDNASEDSKADKTSTKNVNKPKSVSVSPGAKQCLGYCTKRLISEMIVLGGSSKDLNYAINDPLFAKDLSLQLLKQVPAGTFGTDLMYVTILSAYLDSEDKSKNSQQRVDDLVKQNLSAENFSELKQKKGKVPAFVPFITAPKVVNYICEILNSYYSHLAYHVAMMITSMSKISVTGDVVSAAMRSVYYESLPVLTEFINANKVQLKGFGSLKCLGECRLVEKLLLPPPKVSDKKKSGKKSSSNDADAENDSQAGDEEAEHEPEETEPKPVKSSKKSSSKTSKDKTTTVENGHKPSTKHKKPVRNVLADTADDEEAEDIDA